MIAAFEAQSHCRAPERGARCICIVLICSDVDLANGPSSFWMAGEASESSKRTSGGAQVEYSNDVLMCSWLLL